MNLHSNARLTLKCRVALVEAVIQEGLTLKRAAARFKVSERTAAKWVGRFRREGWAGLPDRSSRPASHSKTTSTAQVAVVLALRQMRLPGCQIAKYTNLSRATVSRILNRHELAELRDLDPPPRFPSHIEQSSQMSLPQNHSATPTFGHRLRRLRKGPAL